MNAIFHFLGILLTNKCFAISGNTKLKQSHATQKQVKNLFSNENPELEQELLDLTPYEYPTTSSSHYYIAIFGTNDIHGSFYPNKISIPNTEDTYENGGLEYLGKYISILRDEWQDRFLWFDGGDEFQGGIESRISSGSIITEFFNIMGGNGATLGNHEWDYGPEYGYTRLENSNFPYGACNIRNTTSNLKEFLPKQVKSKIYEVGKVKIGVIGLAIKMLPETSSGKFNDIEFLEYKANIIEQAKILRPEVNALILVAHVELECSDNTDKYILKLWDKRSPQTQCKESTAIYNLLRSLPPDTIDAVISAHSHNQTHHWISNVPVMSNENNGKYASVMYLAFDPEDFHLIRDNIKIESPGPICKQVFDKTHLCDQMSGDDIFQSLPLVDYKYHKKQIIKESLLKPLYNKYWDRYQSYSNDIVTKLDKEMVKNKKAEHPLGNGYCDIMKKVTGADVSVINVGLLRIKWSEGNLAVSSVISMSPYENRLISFDVYGWELKKMIRILQEGKYKYYPTSGLKQVISEERGINGVGFDGKIEKEINDDSVYRMASLDFLIIQGGDDFSKVTPWFVPRNVVEYDILFLEVIEYGRNIDLLRVDSLVDKENPRLRLIK